MPAAQVVHAGDLTMFAVIQDPDQWLASSREKFVSVPR